MAAENMPFGGVFLLSLSSSHPRKNKNPIRPSIFSGRGGSSLLLPTAFV